MPTVLVVEDSDDFRMLVGVALRGSGFRVVEATNGKEALTYLGSHPTPEVIVLDIRMPVMDAWEFRSAQANDTRLRDIPVIVYSCEPDIARLAGKLHAQSFVSKAEGPRRVLEEVCRWCH